MSNRPRNGEILVGVAVWLRLTTLGGASLLCAPEGGSDSTLLGPGKPLALLAYLAFSPGRAASREHLVDLLWSHEDPKAANHSFRQTVWYLKQRLGEEAFETREGNLALVVPLASDREDFLAAIDEGELERAVALYRGDLLPGFGAPGPADFRRCPEHAPTGVGCRGQSPAPDPSCR